MTVQQEQAACFRAFLLDGRIVRVVAIERLDDGTLQVREPSGQTHRGEDICEIIR